MTGRRRRAMRARLYFLLAVFVFTPATFHTVALAATPLPSSVHKRPADVGAPPEAVIANFLGIPYRPDGVINDIGKYARFKTPTAALPTPGLNCSGFVLAASRAVLQKNILVAEAVRDRMNDSGPDAAFGQDWDFGFDLIMNISEGTKRAFVLPQGENTFGKNISGRDSAVWNPHEHSFAQKLFPRLKQGSVYLVSFSKHSTPDSPARLHYHVGMIVRDSSDNIWHYDTTHAGGKVMRQNLAAPEGLAKFRHSFRNTKKSFKRLTIIEISLSQDSASTPSPSPPTLR